MVVDATRKAVQGTTSLQPETPVRKTQEMWDGFDGFVGLWETSRDKIFARACCIIYCELQESDCMRLLG